jgi:uncharacterized small protein (DUF1192 family)
MIEEEAGRPRAPVHQIGQDLSALAIAEIDERIVLLKDEIERLAEARARKLSSQAAADALFRR